MKNVEKTKPQQPTESDVINNLANNIVSVVEEPHNLHLLVCRIENALKEGGIARRSNKKHCRYFLKHTFFPFLLNENLLNPWLREPGRAIEITAAFITVLYEQYEPALVHDFFSLCKSMYMEYLIELEGDDSFEVAHTFKGIKILTAFQSMSEVLLQEYFNNNLFRLTLWPEDNHFYKSHHSIMMDKKREVSNG